MVTYSYLDNHVLVDNDNLFVYEVSVFVKFKNYFSMVKNTYYSSSKEIKNIVYCYNKTPNVQIITELFSAPKDWLLENNYSLYIPKEKKKKKNK